MRDEPAPHILWTSPQVHVESDCACSDSDIASILSSVPSDGQAESDCACPTAYPIPGEGFSVPSLSLWHLPSPLYRAPLSEAHELVFNPLGPAGVVVLNEPARRILDTFAVPRPLSKTTDARLALLRLIQPLSCNPEPETFKLETLIAWLHVTSQCNLRCAYCYAPRSGETMDEETGHAAIEAVFRAALCHGFRAVKLKYAGGEPTLRFPTVQELHHYAQRLSARYGLELRAVLLSNGTLLTDGMLEWLHSEGVRLMLSLDGIGAVHDAQRHFADGRGSSAVVARAVDRALKHGLTPYLSITVTPRSADGLADAVAFALERDLPFNLNLVRPPGVGQVGNLSYGDDRIIAGVKAAFAVIEGRLPRRRLIDALVDRAAFGGPHEYPCGAGRNYLVIDPQGRVARCQMTMNRPVTDIWAADPLQAVREWRDGFQNVAVDEKESCRDCIWRYWCAGGCPLLTYRTTGRSDMPSPYCAVYKALYPDVLRLEGLRLLKWQPPPV